MCGINGIFAQQGINQLPDRLKAMNQAIAHRGPDGEGIATFSQNQGFGHRRLAILDLDTRANQPMINNDQTISIIFNGEIYNFQELKKELAGSYKFKTTSDTEVLLAGYQCKGLDWLLDHINGMYSFALFDAPKEKLFLVRDRFGIKPLYYYFKDHCLIFSSEIKGILASGLFEPSFNPAAIDEYLGYRYVREPNTFFKDIYQVPSAHYLTFHRGEFIQKKKYWQLPELNFETHYDEQKILQATKSRLVDAVHRWLIADVRVGAYLSGGVDSSLTSAIMAQKLKDKVDTYTIGFQEEGFNEFKYAQMVADKYQTNHHAFVLQHKDYFKEWERLISFKDAPLAVPNEIPLAIMTSLLSKDITVVISGEGADELFGGYGRIFRSPFDFKHQTNYQDFFTYFSHLYEYVPREVRDTYLVEQRNYRSEFDQQIGSEFLRHKNEENVFRFFHHYHIQGLLARVDMTTMQTSIEARPPFLDHQLIEYVYSEVPYSLKLKWNSPLDNLKAATQTADQYSEILDTPKYILKKIGEDFLPKEIIYRKKMGFPVPLTQWFPKLESMALDLLTQANWVKKDKINELIVEIKESNSTRSGQLLWMFLNVELFKQAYFSKSYKW